MTSLEGLVGTTPCASCGEPKWDHLGFAILPIPHKFVPPLSGHPEGEPR